VSAYKNRPAGFTQQNHPESHTNRTKQAQPITHTHNDTNAQTRQRRRPRARALLLRVPSTLPHPLLACSTRPHRASTAAEHIHRHTRRGVVRRPDLCMHPALGRGSTRGTTLRPLRINNVHARASAPGLPLSPSGPRQASPLALPPSSSLCSAASRPSPLSHQLSPAPKPRPPPRTCGHACRAQPRDRGRGRPYSYSSAPATILLNRSRERWCLSTQRRKRATCVGSRILRSSSETR
jgi:hypothetical protein